MDIPDYAIERIARCMLPMLQRYYESEEGQRELGAHLTARHAEASSSGPRLTKWKKSKELPDGK